MNNLLLFSIFTLFVFLPVAILFVYFLYKKTIVFPIAVIVFASAVFCSLMSYIIGERGFWVLLWIVPLCGLGLFALNYIIKRIIQKPLINLKEDIDLSAQGVLDFEINNQLLNKENEIGSIAKSLQILVEALNKMAYFSDEIGKGNFELDYKLLSDKDKIGKALLNMRASLVEAQKNELIRKEKEQIENWSNQGIAKFSDILRADNNSVEKLAVHFIKELVNYLDANQGGIFIINEDNPEHIVYELKGAVAYNREKLMDKSFGMGESLVGRCAYEKLPIHLKDVPDNYVQITSGLGSANPKNILLIPAVLNNKVFAVIEIASFNVFEDYMVNFMTNIGEDLASTLASTKVNEQTQKLLEETRQQREELAAQEEEMRQNLEELQATQEEMKRKELELTNLNEELQNKLKDSIEAE